MRAIYNHQLHHSGNEIHVNRRALGLGIRGIDDMDVYVLDYSSHTGARMHDMYTPAQPVRKSPSNTLRRRVAYVRVY